MFCSCAWFLGEQTTHEWGQMTVTFLQNGCDVTSDQSFDWPDAADVVSSVVFVRACLYMCAKEGGRGGVVMGGGRKEWDYNADSHLAVWLYDYILSTRICGCLHACGSLCVCVHWKPSISQAYQIGQSTSSWLRLWDWPMLPVWTAKHQNPALILSQQRDGKKKTHTHKNIYIPLFMVRSL